MPLSRLHCLAMAASLAVCAARAAGTPILDCHFETGSKVEDRQFAMAADPYAPQAIRINDFRFKAVVIGAARRVDYVKLYTYYDHGEDGKDVRLLHEARYLAPDPRKGSALTGTVFLYEPVDGQEFKYACQLREEAP